MASSPPPPPPQSQSGVNTTNGTTNHTGKFSSSLLDFTKLHFVGRVEELATLRKTYQSAASDDQEGGLEEQKEELTSSDNESEHDAEDFTNTNDSSELPAVTLIYGESGCGKSTLVMKFISEFYSSSSSSAAQEEDHGGGGGVPSQHRHFMRGKFFEGGHSTHFSAIIDSINTYASYLATERPDDFQNMIEKVEEILGTGELCVLLVFIPELVPLFYKQSDEHDDDDNDDDDDDSNNVSRRGLSKAVLNHLSILSEEGNHSSSAGRSLTSSVRTLGALAKRQTLSSSLTDLAVPEGFESLASTTVDVKNSSTKQKTKNGKDHIPTSPNTKGQQQAQVTTLSQDKVWNRLKYILCTFFKIIINTTATATTINKANNEQVALPLILFLDDLQWADKESLDLIMALLTDNSLSNMIFLGSVRESSRIDTDGFTKAWESLTPTSRIRKVQKMKLPTLNKHEMHVYISRVLNISPHDEKEHKRLYPLSKMLHARTKGNIYFLQQSLEQLERNQFLYYSYEDQKWNWGRKKKSEEKKQIAQDDNNNNSNSNSLSSTQSGESDSGSKYLSANDLDAVKAKILSCSPEIQIIINIATFTFHSIDYFVFQRLLESMGHSYLDDEDLEQLLDDTVAKHLLVYDSRLDVYHISHDIIRQAGLSLVSRQEENELRAEIGKALYDLYNEGDGGEWMLTVAATNLNSTNFKNMIGLKEMAQLNLDAGLKSLANAAFDPALIFLKFGVQSLRKIHSHWKHTYVLSLDLYRAITDTFFYMDQQSDGERCANEVLNNATSTEDKIPTYLTLSMFYARKDFQNKSLKLMLSAVQKSKLFPRRVLKIRALKCLKRIKTWYKKHCDEDVLKLPILTDQKHLYVVKCFAEGGLRAGYLGKDLESVLFCVYGLRVTFKFGLSAEASMFITTFANIVLVVYNDFELAMKFANLAKKIIERVPVKDVAGWTYFGLASYLFAWTLKSEELLLLCQRGYRSGMESGSLEIAFINRFTLNRTAYAVGYPLKEVANAIDETVNQLGIYQVQATLVQTDQIRLFLYVLMGKRELDWDEMMAFRPEADEVDTDLHRLTIGYLMRMKLGVYFGNFEFARIMKEKFDGVSNANDFASKMKLREIELWMFSFLLASGLSYRKNDPEQKKIAETIAKTTRKRLKSRGNSSDDHIQLLMDAELKSLNEVTSKQIEKAYKKAATSALDHGFTQHAALMLELAGEKLLKVGDTAASRGYFTAAKHCYLEWGAIAKVRQMVRHRSEYLNAGDLANSILPLEEYFEKNRKSRRPELLSFDFTP